MAGIHASRCTRVLSKRTWRGLGVARILGCLLIAVLLQAGLAAILVRLEPPTTHKTTALQLERHALVKSAVPRKSQSSLGAHQAWTLDPAWTLRVEAALYRLAPRALAPSAGERFVEYRTAQARAPPRLG
jgi:peptidoglycan/LPS O-acetylase OafA/YrhL